MSQIRQNIFMTVALLIGLGLIILSFYLTPLVETPLVEKSTDRAKQAVRGVQILGVAIFCISVTKLTCQGRASNFNILLGIMFLLGGVCTGLFAIIHNDCVDARKFTPYALGVSVSIIVGTLVAIVVHNRKREIAEEPKQRPVISDQDLKKIVRGQNNEFNMLKNKQSDDESNVASETTTPESEDFYDAPEKTKEELLHELLDDSQNFDRYLRNVDKKAKSSKIPPRAPSSFVVKDSPKATLSTDYHPLKSTRRDNIDPEN